MYNQIKSLTQKVNIVAWYIQEIIVHFGTLQFEEGNCAHKKKLFG